MRLSKLWQHFLFGVNYSFKLIHGKTENQHANKEDHAVIKRNKLHNQVN